MRDQTATLFYCLFEALNMPHQYKFDNKESTLLKLYGEEEEVEG
jgi:hypothetical protein